jgi:hypothetical protein
MKKLIVFFFILVVGNSISQTNVSGGIYQNTTWTLAGSPYIVTGSIVVFPGKTLTIEPGCEVRFNADYTFNTGNFIYLEIRGTLIALGTDANKIKFTSSDTTDGFFNWQGINIKGSQGGSCQLDRIELHNSYFGIYNDVSEPGTIYNFTNCRFKNNSYALQLNADLNYTNCIFEKNSIGQASQILYGSMTASNCQFINNFCSVTWSNYINLTDCVFSGNANNIIGSPGNIQNCSFINNTFGFAESYNLQISNCLFDGNEVGIDDTGSSSISNSVFTNNIIAVKLGTNSSLANNIITENGTGVQVRGANPSSAQILDNLLCNNTNYNLENLTDKNFQVNTNCFCSSDSTTIENGIYDGYDDITRGLVNYAIYDDSCSSIISYVTKVELNETAVLEVLDDISTNLYPNPTSDVVTLNMTADKAIITVVDAQGKILQTSIVENGGTVSLASYETGMYIFRITTENGTSIHRISKN